MNLKHSRKHHKKHMLFNTILASQVSDFLTPIKPLADLTSGYRTCPGIPGHPIKMHV